MTSTSRRFANVASSVPASRRYVGGLLARLPRDVRETAKLLVSELATNALLYSADEFEVTLDMYSTPERLRIGVADVSAGEPRLGRPSKFDEHGRGLQLVASLSDRWGVDRRGAGGGKTVWFELGVPVVA